MLSPDEACYLLNKAVACLLSVLQQSILCLPLLCFPLSAATFNFGSSCGGSVNCLLLCIVPAGGIVLAETCPFQSFTLATAYVLTLKAPAVHSPVPCASVRVSAVLRQETGELRGT